MRILAHGDHPLTTVWEALSHQFTEVDHLATMAAAVGLALLAVAVRSTVRRRAIRVGERSTEHDSTE